MKPSTADLIILSPLKEEILMRTGGTQALATAFPRLVREAIDFVIDPIRTARTTIGELDNVEKTFLGLKLEHVIRDFFDVPKGLRDLVICGVDVDVKNTVGSTWMIPKETYSESGVCLVSRIDAAAATCSLGLLVARLEYLGQPNRDQKRAVTAEGRKHVAWLLQDVSLGASVWSGIDMARFRELRQMTPGAQRAAQFFREHLDRLVDRGVVQSLLFDQRDYMKRLRGNGGARDLLLPEGIELTVEADGSCIARLIADAPDLRY